MKKKMRLLLVMSGVLLLAMSACEKGEGENETNISSYLSERSHHTGDNCMNCHQSGGPGEGWFTVAGTVYRSDKSSVYPGATVRLYTGPAGTGSLMATIEVDKKGNFHTTEAVDFGSGLYPVVEGDQGSRSMNSAISNGQCNSCHGSGTDRIWTE